MKLALSPRTGLGQLAFALAGGADSLGQQAGQAETRRLSDLALNAARSRKLGTEADLGALRLNARRNLGASIGGSGLFPKRDPNAIAGIINSGTAPDPTGGLGNLAKLFLEQAVQGGMVDPTRAAQGRFAARGGPAPFVQNAAGSVLNVGAGSVDQTNPIAEATLGNIGAQVAQRNAAAGLDTARTGQVLPLAEALIGQRNAAAALSDAKRTSPGGGATPLTATRTEQALVARGIPPEIAQGVAFKTIRLVKDPVGLSAQFIDLATQRVVGTIDSKGVYTPAEPLAPAAPAPGAPVQRPPGLSDQSLLDQARAALDEGRDPALILQRLQAFGIDPRLL